VGAQNFNFVSEILQNGKFSAPNSALSFNATVSEQHFSTSMIRS